MMTQWRQCKEQAAGALLLFRLGDFYEAFHEDALLLSKELDLTLTRRQEVPMAGVPFHASDGHIDKLVGKGYRVAIAEQVEDPKSAKGLVKREVVRIITPGTLIQSGLLSDKSNNFLACIVEEKALSLLDLSTAEFKVLEFATPSELIDELYRTRPREILLSNRRPPPWIEECRRQFGALIHMREAWHFDKVAAEQRLLRHFQLHCLDGLGLKEKSEAIRAAGAILYYVHDELHLPIHHIQTLRLEQRHFSMHIDRSTLRHLEIIEPLHKEGCSLLQVIDYTETPMGGRALKQWLTSPLLDRTAIEERQDKIAELLKSPERLETIRRHLEEIRDLQRLMMRIETGCATPRDLRNLATSLQAASALQEHTKSPDLTPLVTLLFSALVEAPPLRISDGGLFKEGYNAKLDELRHLHKGRQEWVAGYQVRLREETQIKTLKVGYTQAFGYYIEVSRSQAEKMPPHFERKQTLVNAERFITGELKEFEYQMLHAEERLSAIEQELFSALRRTVATDAPLVYATATAIATLDCLSSLAHAAHIHRFSRPTITETGALIIHKGRHPIVELHTPSGSYIPNDLALNTSDARLHILTGPNMAGKSTFIRQAALLVLLAQIGSFVPAESAEVGIVDKLFSRIGASDDLSRGQSTFMVEMTETAHILNHATSRSLVILDEIGRGTSTYDGISIAWAVAEELLRIGSRTLFATHYWELTDLENQSPGAINYHVAVHEGERGIVFLRKIVRGSTDKSYGIHVAKLAALPPAVIARAEELLQGFERKAELDYAR
jgi:DNA mismatch repair protein MutS